MDSGGIWPGDESYFQNIRETALQDTIEQLTKELAEARAEIAALKRVNVALNEEIKIQRAYVTGRDNTIECKNAVIERKDKLIEQMREAIKLSLIADEVRQTRNVCASDINDACETSKVKRIASLSAAERGE